MTSPDTPNRAPFDPRVLAAVAVCALIWGTTWFVITLQLGSVDPTISVIYRFGLASMVLFGFCLIRREPLGLTLRQHIAVAGQGLLIFSVQYSLVYHAEQYVASAVMAVIFAGMAFANLVLFRVLVGEKASSQSWLGALLGVAGVAAMSYAELRRTDGGPEAMLGLGLGFLGMIIAASGNLAAWKAQKEGAAVLPALAWAMAYGSGLLAVYALVTGIPFTIEMTAEYIGSLLYLSIFGSVIAFGLYFWLARAKGYALASYISALVPPVAMLVSMTFEGARYGLEAALGLALVLAGQILLIRSPKTV